jgi:hypothetical protein
MLFKEKSAENKYAVADLKLQYTYSRTVPDMDDLFHGKLEGLKGCDPVLLQQSKQR